MVDFSDCYFCGTAADDLVQYRVIPPETDPPAESQRRVVVCPTCREKLDRVIEPVIAHFDPGVDDHPGESTPDPDAGSIEFDEESKGPENHATGTDRGTAEAEGTRETEPVDEAEGDEGVTRTGGSAKVDEAGASEAPDDPVELPAETRQILRLLGNREFPVDRGEIVDVAANAYGVTVGEAEAVVDALIDQGQLREENGTLYRSD